MALGPGCRGLKLLNPLANAELPKISKIQFTRAYLELGKPPIKQNKAVEQQSGGPLEGRPKAKVYITVVSLMGDLVRRV